MARNDTLGLWMVSRHDDVVTVSRDPATYCSSKGIMTFEIGAEYPSPPTMMHTDPPDHTRYRTLVQPGFRPTYMRALEPGIRRRARALVDRIEAGTPVDIVSELAVPLPLQVISDLLGVPEEEWPRFFRWSEAVIPGATDWPEEERARLSGEMVTYLLEAAADRRLAPRDDIISELGAAEVDGDRLTDAELGMFLVQLLVAGNETTRNMMSGGLVGFAEHPGQWEGLAARIDDGVGRALPLAVEEMLRWTTPVVAFMRTTTREVELGGRRLGAGDPVLMLYASANRDEAVFGPDRRRVRRRPGPQPARGLRLRGPLLHRCRTGPGRGSDPARGAPGAVRIDRPGRRSGPHGLTGHRRGEVGAGGVRRPVGPLGGRAVRPGDRRVPGGRSTVSWRRGRRRARPSGRRSAAASPTRSSPPRGRPTWFPGWAA